MFRSAIILVLIAIASQAGHAEIEKKASMCQNGICFYWWPRLPVIPGWHQDQEASFRYSVNAQAQDNFDFSNSPAVFTAMAAYKPRSKNKTLEQFIKEDKKSFLDNSANLTIKNEASLKTEDGQNLICATFNPKTQGNWEKTCYGEEGEFWLTFTVSGNTRQAYEQALPAFNSIISQYREKP